MNSDEPGKKREKAHGEKRREKAHRHGERKKAGKGARRKKGGKMHTEKKGTRGKRATTKLRRNEQQWRDEMHSNKCQTCKTQTNTNLYTGLDRFHAHDQILRAYAYTLQS